jgi:surface polysaccharide O-acyltransferase-like enzyme
MVDPSEHRIALVDSATATALAQILPVLLLTLTVELRRTRLHRALSRIRLGVFFFAFGIVETILVLSIDGALYPFQWFDLVSVLIIFSLLAVIFWLSLVDPPQQWREGAIQHEDG